MVSSKSVSSVVVGVDDSEGAAVALRWTDALLRALVERGAEVRAAAVTAWSPPVFDLAAGVDADLLEQGATEMLARVLAPLPDPDRFEAIVRAGTAVDVLVDEAKRLDADLVVVGTRGRGGLAKLLLGSVSRSIASRTERVVGVVPASATWSDGPTVVGYDGSPGGGAALAWAIDNTDGPITVVSAWQVPVDALYEPDALDVGKLQAEAEAEVERAIAALAERRPDVDVGRITPLVRRDDPRLVLVEESKRAGQLVLGSRSHRGVRGLLLGSTVDYVASHAHQTVVIVPPPEEGDDRG